MTSPSVWMFVGMFWAVVLLLELVVVLIWVRGRARLLAAGGLVLMLFAQILLPGLLGGQAGSVVRQVINLSAMVLFGFAVIASRPVRAPQS